MQTCVARPASRTSRSFLRGALIALCFCMCAPLRVGLAHEGPYNPDLQKEAVQADVSTRAVSITSNFTGTEIIVFGAIENAYKPIDVTKPKSADEIYDIVVIVEGVGSPIMVRRKSRSGGLWLNTDAVKFDSIPSYYAITSTRHLDDITEGHILDQHAIGFEHISMLPATPDGGQPIDRAEREAFKDAVVRLKLKQGLYVQNTFGIAFVGPSLFRTSINLPANVPVGPLTTRVYLFRDGILIDKFESKVRLSREGVGRLIYNFATGYPMLYGIFTVLVAAGAGWAASTYFSSRRS